MKLKHIVFILLAALLLAGCDGLPHNMSDDDVWEYLYEGPWTTEDGMAFDFYKGGLDFQESPDVGKTPCFVNIEHRIMYIDVNNSKYEADIELISKNEFKLHFHEPQASITLTKVHS